MSFSETIFLFFLALIIFGPKKLPEIARQAGRLLAELRRASNEFRSQIETEIAHIEVEKKAQAILPPSSPPPGAVASFESEPAPRRSGSGAVERNISCPCRHFRAGLRVCRFEIDRRGLGRREFRNRADCLRIRDRPHAAGFACLKARPRLPATIRSAMPCPPWASSITSKSCARRLVYSIAAVAVGIFRLLVESREHLRHHAAADHGRAQGQRDVGEARLSESHRTLQPLLEDCGARRTFPDLALCALPGVDVHLARPLPQRKALRRAFHGLDDRLVHHGRIFRLQDRLSRGARIS